MGPVIASLPEQTRLTLTWDQGSEMAHHDKIAEHVTDRSCFAHPGRPWLRSRRENTDGLLRQYFPRGETCRPSRRTTSLADSVK